MWELNLEHEHELLTTCWKPSLLCNHVNYEYESEVGTHTPETRAIWADTWPMITSLLLLTRYMLLLTCPGHKAYTLGLSHNTHHLREGETIHNNIQSYYLYLLDIYNEKQNSWYLHSLPVVSRQISTILTLILQYLRPSKWSMIIKYLSMYNKPKVRFWTWPDIQGVQ